MRNRSGAEPLGMLVKELTGHLKAIAQQFDERADQLITVEISDASVDEADLLAIARRLLSERERRLDHFPSELFHEPAWDMLLALYVADHTGQVMNVKTLVASAHAPVTTSQRWIDHLAKLRLIDRVVDSIDRRRIEVTLSNEGHAAVKSYLHAI